MTQPNIPLLRKAVEWAEAEAAKPVIDCRWRQGDWISEPEDVAFATILDTPLDDLHGPEFTSLFAPLQAQCGTAYCIAGWVGQALDARYAVAYEVDGVHVADFAARGLGISRREAEFEGGLFHAGNTIGDVRRIAEDIAGERL